MLIDFPAAIIRRIAGIPAGVPGIFTIRFGRAMSRWYRVASRTVPSVSDARSGATSIETKPSSPFVFR